MVRESTKAVMLALVLVGLGTISVSTVVCCGNPKPGMQAIEPRVDEPAATNGFAGQTPASQPATQPEPNAANEPVVPEAEPNAPTESDEPDTPKLPPFVEVSERIDAKARVVVEAEIQAPRTLTLETENAQALKLTRRKLEIGQGRSIVLRIDGQGIEWTADTIDVELKRNSAGVWEVVRRSTTHTP